MPMVPGAPGSAATSQQSLEFLASGAPAVPVRAPAATGSTHPPDPAPVLFGGRSAPVASGGGLGHSPLGSGGSIDLASMARLSLSDY